MMKAIAEFKNKCSLRRSLQKNLILVVKYLAVMLLLSAIMMSVRTVPTLSHENKWSVTDLFTKNSLCGRIMSPVKMKILLEKLCLMEIGVKSVLATIGMLKTNKYSWLMMLPWTLTYIYFSIISAKHWADMLYRMNDRYDDDMSNARLSVEGIFMFGSYYVLLNSVFIYKMLNLNYSKFIQYQIEDEITQFEKQLDQLVDRTSI